jgi:hypothetical protein
LPRGYPPHGRHGTPGGDHHGPTGSDKRDAAFHSTRGVRSALKRLAATGIDTSLVHVVGFEPTAGDGGGRPKGKSAEKDDRDTLVSIEAETADTAEQARLVLEESGADRVDAVDENGSTLPPESEVQ